MWSRNRSPVRGRITRRRTLFCKLVRPMASLARWLLVLFSLGSVARGSSRRCSLYLSLVFQRATSRRRGRTSDAASTAWGSPRRFSAKPFRRAAASIIAAAHARAAALRQRCGRSRASAGRSRPRARCFCASLPKVAPELLLAPMCARSSRCFVPRSPLDKCVI